MDKVREDYDSIKDIINLFNQRAAFYVRRDFEGFIREFKKNIGEYGAIIDIISDYFMRKKSSGLRERNGLLYEEAVDELVEKCNKEIDKRKIIVSLDSLFGEIEDDLGTES